MALTMPKPVMLFSAPHDFDIAVWDEYQEHFDTLPPPREAEVWVCNPKAPFVIDEAQLARYPKLRVIATPSTGTNHIDLDACRERGVKVLSLLDDREGLETISASAEFTFKLLLDALRLPPARELQGKSVTLVGYGRIGQKLFEWLRSFGAKAVWYDPKYSAENCGVYMPIGILERLMFVSDAVVICCSLTEETRGMITGEMLRSLPYDAALINTARGEIIREGDLLEVMDERPDLRVALDVLCGETTGTQDPEPLIRLGAIVTPHIAGETFDSRTKAARITLNLLRKEFQHEFQSRVTA